MPHKTIPRNTPPNTAHGKILDIRHETARAASKPGVAYPVTHWASCSSLVRWSGTIGAQDKRSRIDFVEIGLSFYCEVLTISCADQLLLYRK